MKLIFGIGNPGRRYEGTRHNVGFDIFDLLARKIGAPAAKEKLFSLVTDGRLAGEKVVLVQPQTYMNKSGRAVRGIVDWFDVELEDTLVICDDLSLPLAKLRLRKEGSSGGHNGLKSIEQHLGHNTFPRLRVGIGEVPVVGGARMDPADFVLSKFLPEERDDIQACYERAVDVVAAWVRDGVEEAMNAFN